MLGAAEFPNLYLQPKLDPDFERSYPDTLGYTDILDPEFERSYPDTLGYMDILQAKLISRMTFSPAELET